MVNPEGFPNFFTASELSLPTGFVTPGMRPMEAISRKVRRDNLNFLRKPRARPVI